VRNFVSISGYGWTGSSACIDILHEFKGFGALKGEFRIAKDPYGLIDLENSLVHNWDFVRHDVAIKDFLNYCKVLSREEGLFSQVGKNFSSKLHVDFMSESEAYIDRLTDTTYYGDTSIHRYYISRYKNLFMKIRSKLGKNNVKNMHLSRPSEVDFIRETKVYIDNLLSGYMSLNKINTLILDQAVPPTNIVNISRYFENVKMIVVDRDPRDIYSNLVKNNVLIGADLSRNDSANKYIKWHKTLRNNFQGETANGGLSSTVLRINFEDLVYNYEQSINKILLFLGDDVIHENKFHYFDPGGLRARGNVGLWKTYKNQFIMDEIYNELGEYCYNH
jgi:hypothetical protein